MSTGQAFLHLTEHNERAWSVDFSRVDPTKLASGSDDHFVKLWSINKACFPLHATVHCTSMSCIEKFPPPCPPSNTNLLIGGKSEKGRSLKFSVQRNAKEM